MFGLSFPELIVIFGIALIFFGPDHLPELARKLGKLSAEVKKASDSVRREFYNSVYTPVQGDIDASRRELTSMKNFLADMAPPDPNCPDYQAKMNTQALTASASSGKEDSPSPSVNDQTSSNPEPSQPAPPSKESHD